MFYRCTLFFFQTVISEVTERMAIHTFTQYLVWEQFNNAPQRFVDLYPTEKSPKTPQNGHFGERVRH